MPSQPNNSLIQGIACFQAVTGATGPVGSRELARRLGLTHTRTNRLLGTLAVIGLVEQTANRKYRPGPGLHVLAAQSMRASRLLPVALPYLMSLRRDGFTVALGVLWQGQVCYLFHERPWQAVDEAIGRHDLYPAEMSSIGVALLAAKPDALEPVQTEASSVRNTLVPGESLSHAINDARRDGYALRRFIDGEISLGVTIGTPPVAGLAVSGKHIGEDFIPRIVERLHTAARSIAGALNASPRDAGKDSDKTSPQAL